MAITKAALIATLQARVKVQDAELIEQGHTIEALRQQLGDAQHKLQASNELRSDLVKSVVAKTRSIVPVFEWDQRIPGDFARALKLAKENNGRCQRVRSGN